MNSLNRDQQNKTDRWEAEYSKIMIEWIESQWKIEQAYQAGEPYTRMKFEEDANRVEVKLKNLISQLLSDARRESMDFYEKKYRYSIEVLEKQNSLLLEQLRMKHLSEPIVFEVKEALTTAEESIKNLE